jgi:hypothetical protein
MLFILVDSMKHHYKSDASPIWLCKTWNQRCQLLKVHKGAFMGDSSAKIPKNGKNLPDLPGGSGKVTGPAVARVVGLNSDTPSGVLSVTRST